MNKLTICGLSSICSLVISSCAPMGFSFGNVDPLSKYKSILAQPSVLSVKIPQGYKNLDASEISVEVRKKSTISSGFAKKHPQAKLMKEDIGNDILRWKVDIAPEKWRSGPYELKFFSSGRLIHELDVNFGYEFYGPYDY